MDVSDVPSWAQQLLTIIGASGAVYGGIRGDIKAMHERMQRVEKALDDAHDRIDQMMRDAVRNMKV